MLSRCNKCYHLRAQEYVKSGGDGQRLHDLFIPFVHPDAIVWPPALPLLSSLVYVLLPIGPYLLCLRPRALRRGGAGGRGGPGNASIAAANLTLSAAARMASMCSGGGTGGLAATSAAAAALRRRSSSLHPDFHWH